MMEARVIHKLDQIQHNVNVSLQDSESPDGGKILFAELHNDTSFPVYVMKGDVEFAIHDDRREVRLYYGYHPEMHERPGVYINLVIPILQPIAPGDKFEWHITYKTVLKKLSQKYAFLFLVRVAAEPVSGQGSRVGKDEFNEYLSVSTIVQSNAFAPD
jgi:hypothetical protein